MSDYTSSVTPRLLYRSREQDDWVETVWRNFDDMCRHYGYGPVSVACSRVMEIVGVSEENYYHDHYGLHMEGKYSDWVLDDAFHRM